MPIYVTRLSMPSLEDYIEEIKPSFENLRLLIWDWFTRNSRHSSFSI